MFITINITSTTASSQISCWVYIIHALLSIISLHVESNCYIQLLLNLFANIPLIPNATSLTLIGVNLLIEYYCLTRAWYRIVSCLSVRWHWWAHFIWDKWCHCGKEACSVSCTFHVDVWLVSYYKDDHVSLMMLIDLCQKGCSVLW